MTGAESTVAAGSVGMLASLFLCGFMGLLGQGVRAAIGLKNAASGPPDQQTVFSAAYLFISLMIGFIAGVLAGIGVGIDQIAKVSSGDVKILLGIAAAGYAGADFIENSFSRLLPGVTSPTRDAGTGTKAAPQIKDANAQQQDGAKTESPAANDPSPVAPIRPAIATRALPDTLQSLGPALGIVAPRVRLDVWLPALSTAFQKFDLLTDKRVAAAIGQFLVEAGASFQEIVEDLDYTHASRIREVFPTHFQDENSAQAYVGRPRELANKVYANRLGNGDEASGDGFRFCGRGLIQLTGRSEYIEFAATIGKTAEEASAYCETPEGAAMSGCWYLSSRGCLMLADNWLLTQTTRKVNGDALLGNAQRIAYSNAILKALGGQRDLGAAA